VLPLLVTGEIRYLLTLSLALVFWVLFTELYDVWDKLSHTPARLRGFLKLSRSYKGMVLAHLGVAVCVTGVAVTSAYSVERDVRMQIDETVTVGPYGFRLHSLRDFDGPNYRATRATIDVLEEDGQVAAVLSPEKRLYMVQQMPMTEVAIKPSLTRELYIALGERLPDGGWAVRVYYKPFVRWIWLGAIIMAMGGLFAVSDPRYRLARKQQRAAPKSASAKTGDADVAPV
jgi:cytochrome c-type biogenesis protein CcmF